MGKTVNKITALSVSSMYYILCRLLHHMPMSLYSGAISYVLLHHFCPTVIIMNSYFAFFRKAAV